MLKFIPILFIISLLQGCAFVANTYKLYPPQGENILIDSEKSFDETQLIYDEKLRTYKFQDLIIFDSFRRKVTDQNTAMKLVKTRTKEEFRNNTDHFVFGASVVYAIPNFYYSYLARIAIWILDLPFHSVGYYAESKRRNIIFNYYNGGIQSYKDGNFEQAQQNFENTINLTSYMIHRSNTLYWLAKTHYSKGDIEAAKGYFKLFLQYSIQLYPDYFSKIDDTFIEYPEELYSQFDEAEKLLKL